MATAIKVFLRIKDTWSSEGIDVNYLLDSLRSLQKEITDGNAPPYPIDSDGFLITEFEMQDGFLKPINETSPKIVILGNELLVPGY